MLVVERRDGCPLYSANAWQAVILGHRLVAAVCHAPIAGGPTDNRAQHPERGFERDTNGAVVGVHQRVGSGLNLGDAVHTSADVVSTRSTGRDNLARQASSANLVRCPDEALHGLTRARLALAALTYRLEMPFVPHHAAKLDAGGLTGSSRQCQRRFARLHAAPPLTDIQVNEHAKAHAGIASGARQRFESG